MGGERERGGVAVSTSVCVCVCVCVLHCCTGGGCLRACLREAGRGAESHAESAAAFCFLISDTSLELEHLPSNLNTATKIAD